MSKKIITRFAPSPTGFMHIGSVRTALFAYLAAKQTNGTFILRIEDTDKSREVAGSISHIIESLKWLGIEWDYGPDKPGPFGSCIQSDRLASYKKYAEMLVDKGLAYPDPYSVEELETFREKAKFEKKPFLYRNHRPKTFNKWDGLKPLRLKVLEIKRYKWHDAVRGDLEGGEEMLDDIIIIKSDGFPTYNFAHIIDDQEMGVTHVMRGDEFISSTPKFLSIYDALEFPYPTFVSLPPILAPDGKRKLGKRDGAKDLLDYRTEGYLPSAMINFLALIGWNPGTEQEIFSFDELINLFNIDKIQQSGGVFNEEKLLWLNKEYLQKLSDKEYFSYAEKALPSSLKESVRYDTDKFNRLIPSIKERVHVAIEIKKNVEAGEYNWVFEVPKVDLKMLKWKNDKDIMSVKPRLEKILELLKSSVFSTPDSIKNTLWEYAEEVGKGELLWPLRVALTGLERSPDPFTCAFILQRDETIARIESVYDKIVP